MNSESSSPPPHDSPAESPSPRAQPLVVPLPPEQKRPVFRRLLGAAIVLAAWLCVLLMLTGAAARVFFHDRTVPLIWFNAFTLYVYLPAYIVLLFAVWSKRWILAMAAVVVVACHLCWVVPDFVPAKRVFADPSAKAPPTRPIRLMFHNVYGSAREFDLTFREIEETDPDIVVMAEFNSQWRKAAQQRKLQDRYAFDTSRQQLFRRGFNVVFSKFPVHEYPQHVLAPSQMLLDIEIDIDGSPFRLMGIHSPRPMPDGPRRSPQVYEKFYQGLFKRIASADGPLIVVGDFNATQHARSYQQLTAGRLRSAHRDVGRGYATSWPNGKRWLPPIRIDHVLVSPEIECLDVQEGAGPGSDHKPIILDFRVHPPPK